MKALVSILAVVAFAAGCSGAVVSEDQANTEACTLGATQACDLGDAGASALAEQTCVEEASQPVWSTCAPATCSGTEMICLTASGETGVATCAQGQATSLCGVIGDCHPGDTQAASFNNECPAVSCELLQGTWSFPGCYTPIVLAFGGSTVEFTQAAGDFDLAGRAQTVPTRWVSAATPWLALDRNGNGVIDDGSELFGSMTNLGVPGRAPNGFVALTALDDNGDGSITPLDASFDTLLLWRDDNQDRKSEPRELTTLRAAGVLAIHLDYRDAPVCDDGDCAVERSRFDYRDDRGNRQSGEAIDVHLAAR